MKKKKLRLRLWVILLFLFVFLSAMVYGGYRILLWNKEGAQLEDLETQISSLTDIIEKKVLEEDIETLEQKDIAQGIVRESDYYYYMKVPFIEVDFSKLKKKNPDTVGYIKINNTKINYPVVYSGDNTYYLTHAFDKSKNSAGWVFLDQDNNLENLSDNTVIYGHGRVDSTVFGSLKNTLSSSWQENKDNYIIRISTPNKNYVFQIFSIYTIEAESYYIETNFKTQEEKQTWLNTMKERNQAKRTTEVEQDDKILTLSTCKNNYGERIVVQAKLIKQEKR